MEKHKRFSLRFLMTVTVGAALALFMIVFAYIFFNNMLKILSRSEDEQIVTKAGIVSSAIDASMTAARAFATDWASWDETYTFVLGDNPDHFSRYWTEDWKIQGQRYTFLYVQNLSGDDLYHKYYDYFNEESVPPPEDFSSFLSGLGAYMLQDFSTQRNAGAVRPTGRDGVVFYKGVPYYICARPILTYDESSEPAGTLFFGRVFDERELRRISGTSNLIFTVTDGGADEPITRTADTITFSAPVSGFFKDTNVTLRISSSRGPYQNGVRVITVAALTLGAAMLGFAFVIFWLLQRYVLRPIESLSGDLPAVAESSLSIDPNKYGGIMEFYSLTTSINGMLSALNTSRENAIRSTISKETLESILNGLNAYLFVNNIDTYEILFMNDKMKQHFGMDGDVTGLRCDESIPLCIETGRRFCPRSALLVYPEHQFVCEVHRKSTGRYYTQTDLMIDWPGEKNAHLQYFIDITEAKEAEAVLKKRFAQEELASAISKSFITASDIHAFMNNALEMTGKFMNVCRIVLTKFDADAKALERQYIWTSKDHPFDPALGSKLVFREGMPTYDALILNEEEYFVVNDTVNTTAFEQAQQFGATAVMMIAVRVSGVFWGVLKFDQCEGPYDWTESDSSLGRLISNLLSGVLMRQAAERRLTRLETLTNSVRQTAIAYVRPNGYFGYFNPAVCHISGYTAEELNAGDAYQFYDEENKQRFRDEILPQIIENGEYEFELPIVRRDGSTRLINFLGFKIGEVAGNYGFICADVTERRRLERELIEAKESAEQASHAKGEFLSRMSHEMRTPMNAIIGMTNIAKASGDTNKKEYCLEQIENASHHLLGVINDILDMSKIEANKLELAYNAFNIRDMLTNITNMIIFRTGGKQQTFVSEIDPDIPETIISDELRLSQVITNLLSNAAKFTPENGTITLRVQKSAEEDGVCTLHVEVADTGIGITPEQTSRLFASFEQADKGIARKFGGTGLGLAISKRIVNLMNGDIWVESEPGQGSRFIFTVRVMLPAWDKTVTLDAMSLLESEPAGTNTLVGHTLLLAEDIDINREIIEAFLEDTGVMIDFAENGREAYEIFEASPNCYSLILMDIHMPEMDGYEATRRIRALDSPHAKTIPIIAMTANVFKEDIDLCLAAGMNDHIGKPIDTTQLMTKLAKYLPRK